MLKLPGTGAQRADVKPPLPLQLEESGLSAMFRKGKADIKSTILFSLKALVLFLNVFFKMHNVLALLR